MSSYMEQIILLSLHIMPVNRDILLDYYKKGEILNKLNSYIELLGNKTYAIRTPRSE